MTTVGTPCCAVRATRLMPGLLMACAVLALAAAPSAAAEQAPLRDGFEGPEPAWKLLGGDPRYRIDDHRRAASEGVDGTGCEFVQLSASNGTFVHLGYDLERAAVLDELSFTLRLKANRPGVQLLGRVVFPRTLDPRTGAPLSTLVAGESYAAVGQWQPLRLQRLPVLVDTQLRAIRWQTGQPVDPREAYLDRLVLNVYGGPGTTQVWIDDLEATGAVAPARAADPRGFVSTAEPQAPAPRYEVSGSVLLVDGRPTFPRLIDYQGEPLEFLRNLGFNGIRVRGQVSRELLAEAAAAGLWIVAPPPLAPPGEERPWGPQDIDAEYHRVLAWDLGERLLADDVERIRAWAADLREADRAVGRPLVCQPLADVRGYSRVADFLIHDRAPLGTSFELADYRPWLVERGRLARPGTPRWATIQTQPLPELREQITLFAGASPRDSTVDPAQIHFLGYAAVLAGCRGLCFRSDARLDGNDRETQARAAALAALNLELQLIEPWLAQGATGEAVESSRPDVQATLLRIDRGMLLAAHWAGPHDQLVPDQSAAATVTLSVQGVPESHEAYLVVPGGLRPVRHRRQAGVQLGLDEFHWSALVLFTEDPGVVDSVGRRLAQLSPAWTERRRELARYKAETAAELVSELAAAGRQLPQAESLLRTGFDALQLAESVAAGGDAYAAFLAANRASRPYYALERLAWLPGAQALGPLTASPLAALGRRTPQQAAFVREAVAPRRWQNLLVAGELDDLGAMLDAGWRHFQHPQPGIQSAAELSNVVRPPDRDDPRQLDPRAATGAVGQFASTGPVRYSVRLSSGPIDPTIDRGLVETPPTWIVTPDVPITAGTLLRIRGWVRIPEPIQGTYDGLVIFDSAAGEALGLRFGETRGWQPFVLYRVAPRSGPVRVTFALAGFGEAWLDDVAIEVPAAGPPPAEAVTPLGVPIPAGPGYPVGPFPPRPVPEGLPVGPPGLTR